MFAKLFDTELGQVLVKIDANEDDKPEVRFYFEPEGLGICSCALTWGNDDKGLQWKKADKAFAKVDADAAYKVAKGVIDNM